MLWGGYPVSEAKHAIYFSNSCTPHRHMAPRTRAATRAERVHLLDLPAELLEAVALQLRTADNTSLAALALTSRALAAAAANVAKPVAQMLNELGLGGVPIHESLEHNTTIVRALKMALKRKRTRPCPMDGNDAAAQAEALSLIIACEPQASRAELVQGLLDLGFCSWPPQGCVFDLSLLPPLLEALKAYDTFEPGEWDDMFESLADDSSPNNMLRCWGPGHVHACTAYYKKFGENHWTAYCDY